MSVAPSLSLPVKIVDVYIAKENLFKSNAQAASFLRISEWTIRNYKKSGAIFKN